MAIQRCDKLRDNRTATYQVNNQNFYVDAYRIVCDSDMARLDVLSNAQVSGSPDKLPKRLDAHRDFNVIDASSYCQSIKLEPDAKDKRTWLAVCEFGPLKAGQTSADNPEDPVDKPTKWRIEWIEEAAIVTKDIDGEPITNTVGDEFDSPLDEPRLYMVLVADKVYTDLQDIIDLGLEYHRTTNSVEFKGGAARTVKFLPLQTSDIQTENGISFYVATLRFAYNPDTWDAEILNRGWRYRPGVGQAPVKAIDQETNLPVSVPVNLAEDGTLLADGADKVYVRRQYLTPKNYNDINL